MFIQDWRDTALLDFLTKMLYSALEFFAVERMLD
jgi:hypothetical protein